MVSGQLQCYVVEQSLPAALCKIRLDRTCMVIKGKRPNSRQVNLQTISYTTLLILRAKFRRSSAVPAGHNKWWLLGGPLRLSFIRPAVGKLGFPRGSLQQGFVPTCLLFGFPESFSPALFEFASDLGHSS